jgi:hypothetical protein
MLIGKRNVILIDVDLHWPQGHRRPAIDRNYFIVNWAVDGAYAFVRPLFVVLIAGSLSALCCRQILEHQPIKWNSDFIYWPIDSAQPIVRCRFE